MAKKFTWDSWDFDCDGEAYIACFRRRVSENRVIQ